MAEFIRFNIKNAKYAIKNEDGTYESPKSFGYSDSLSLEATSSSVDFYGDGRLRLVYAVDLGKSGTLTLVTLNQDYEIDMGRAKKTNKGIAQIESNRTVPHSIYFEFDAIDESTGVKSTYKTWLYGVTSQRPSETLNQTTDSLNPNNTEIPIRIIGVPINGVDGSPLIENGNEVYAFQETVAPTDADYATFGDACVVPQVAV